MGDRGTGTQRSGRPQDTAREEVVLSSAVPTSDETQSPVSVFVPGVRRGRAQPSASVRTLRARVAAYERWGRCDDTTAATKPARDAFMARFERQADPDGVLNPSERAPRAEALKRAHFARMALKSAQARSRKR